MRNSVINQKSCDEVTQSAMGPRLRSLREHTGVSQTTLANRIGLHQSALSRMEQQEDLLISTLVAYVRGLGASLEILAAFNGEVLPLAGSRSSEEKPDEKTDAPTRDVVFSIKPQYSERILDGAKTVELRRRFPASVPVGTMALIYTTSPVRALTGVVEIEEVVRQTPTTIWKDYAEQACVSHSHFRSYFSGLSTAVAIKLRNAVRLCRPIELAELRERFSFEPPQSFLYAQPELRRAVQNECFDLPHRYECLHRA